MKKYYGEMKTILVGEGWENISKKEYESRINDLLLREERALHCSRHYVLAKIINDERLEKVIEREKAVSVREKNVKKRERLLKENTKTFNKSKERRHNVNR